MDGSIADPGKKLSACGICMTALIRSGYYRKTLWKIKKVKDNGNSIP